MSETAEQQAPQKKALVTAGAAAQAMIPTDLDGVMRLAKMFAEAGDMVPAQYRGKVAACATAILWGLELSLSPINALQSIAIIKGRAALWGDSMLAVALSNPDFISCTDEPLFDTDEKTGKQVQSGVRVTTKRRAKPDVVRDFTIMDAARAGLIARAKGDKGDGPWITFPMRMCYNRARSWALRDQFPDSLRGIASADELNDLAPIEGEFTRVDTDTNFTLEPVEISDAEGAPDRPSSEEPAGEIPEPVAAAGAGSADAEPAAAADAAQAGNAGTAQARQDQQTTPVAVTHKIDIAIDGPKKMLASRLSSAGRTEAELLAGMGKDITMSNINEALKWIKDNEK